MSFRATSWVEERGFLGSFAIYATVLAALSALLPVMYFYGKRIRQWTAGSVRAREMEPDEKGMAI